MRSFFEGWYFKHQLESNMIALIPGYNIEANGSKKAFIQYIDKDKSYWFDYSFNEFYYRPDPFLLKLKNNVFNNKGIQIDMHNKNMRIKGSIEYGKLTPIKGDIMGPFRFLPFMECRHGILSMFHKVNGELDINGKAIKMNDSLGYIEKDWGHSFPKSYFWTQCSDEKNGVCSIMISVADIPYGGMIFKGCICSIISAGTEYRIATYAGAKVIAYSKNYLELRQGRYRITVEINEHDPKTLFAPVKGSMSKTIHENIICTAIYRFYIGNTLVLNLQTDQASFEFVE